MKEMGTGIGLTCVFTNAVRFLSPEVVVPNRDVGAECRRRSCRAMGEFGTFHLRSLAFLCMVRTDTNATPHHLPRLPPRAGPCSQDVLVEGGVSPLPMLTATSTATTCHTMSRLVACTLLRYRLLQPCSV
mmetsp:Transcript_24631/g.68673  ORF Transcript_24631/g.68673 Transcript_24631/m.68673 type:complete len:130 (+) Transcript_24631:454-843(+)